VAYWTFVTAWYWVRIAPGILFFGLLHNNPVGRGVLLRDIETTLLELTWCAVTLGVAWLAAFRRYNWARFAFVGAVLFREVVGIAMDPQLLHALLQGVGPYHYDELYRHWFKPRPPLTSLALLAASIFVFTGNARTWFQTRTAS